MPRVSIPSRTRIPLWTRWLWRSQARRFGQPLQPVQIWSRSPKLFWRFLSFFRALERSASPLDPVLRALVTVKVSQINHCAFCVDFNANRVLEKGKENQAKLDALEDFDIAEVFSDAEKAALAYAEAVTRSDREVDDALFARVREHYDEDAAVELTALIAFQNLSSKFNSALDIDAHGFCRVS